MRTECSSEKLIAKIAAAFPSSFDLSHEDCTDARRQLFSSREDDLFKLIGPLLCDLVLHHNRASCDPSTAGSVVRFLASANPAPLEAIYDGRLDTSQIEVFTNSQKADSQRLFAKFSTPQALAIVEWLQAALSWNERHLPEGEIKAALEYWSERNAVNCPPGS